MKLFELVTPTAQELFEQIHSTNNTGFRTEDLVQVVLAEAENEWSEAMTADELTALIDSWAA